MPEIEDDEARLLRLIEDKHRERCGTERRFAYTAVEWIPGLYKLSIVEEDEPGHFPISEDIFAAHEHKARARADTLNSTRLGLTRGQAALIIASSMSGDVERARR